MKEKINYFNCMTYKCELCRYNEQCFGKKYKNNKVGEKKGAPQLVPLKVKENGKVQLEILPQGGAVLVNK